MQIGNTGSLQAGALSFPRSDVQAPGREPLSPQETFAPDAGLRKDSMTEKVKNYLMTAGPEFLGREVPTTREKVSEEAKQQILDTLKPGDLILSKHHLIPAGKLWKRRWEIPIIPMWLFMPATEKCMKPPFLMAVLPFPI